MIKKIFTLLLFVSAGVFTYAQTVDITFEVNAANITVDANGLYVAGGTGFGVPGDNAMSDSDNDGIWTVTITKPLNFSSHYTFLNGNCSDWSCKEDISGQACADAANYNDRFLPRVTQDTTIKTCFAQCSTDGSCSTVSEYDITLSVDMNEYTGDAFTTVFVSGDFNGWSGNANALNDDDADGIWTTSITTTKDSIEYKFQLDEWTNQEAFTGGESCTKTTGAFTNRFLMTGQDVVVPAVCFASCDACASSANPMVTFQVDMNNYTESYTTVNLNGTFNGWCGACAEMTDADSDGVYEITVELAAGDIEYKFTVDGWDGQENFVGGEACTKSADGFTNRAYTVAEDATLPVVCWESCDACGDAPTMVDVTFQVDMNAFEGDEYTTVNLNGTFNEWCGACAEMLDEDADGVYELTVSLAADEEVDYKFTLDGWDQQEEFTEGDACTTTKDGFTNRSYTPMEGGATLDVVCYNSCEACATGFGEFDLNAFTVSPNPSNGVITVNFTEQMNGSVVIFDNQGREVFSSLNSVLNTKTIDLTNAPAGIYLIKVSGNEKVGYKQIILE